MVAVIFGLTMQTRKRVLINAFTVRALRDTFSPARAAGMSFPLGIIFLGQNFLIHSFLQCCSLVFWVVILFCNYKHHMVKGI